MVNNSKTQRLRKGNFLEIIKISQTQIREIDNPEDQLEMVNCQLCGEQLVKMFASEHTCSQNTANTVKTQRAQTGKKEIKCEKCNQTFNDEGVLADHLEAHRFQEMELDSDHEEDQSYVQSRQNNQIQQQQQQQNTQSYLDQQRRNQVEAQLRNRPQIENLLSQLQMSSSYPLSHGGPSQGGRRMVIVYGGRNPQQFIVSNNNSFDFFPLLFQRMSQQRMPQYINGVDVSSMNDDQLYDYIVKFTRNYKLIQTQMEQKMNEKPLDKGILESLPESVFHKKDKNEESKEEQKDGVDENKCMICMSDFEEGEQLKTLTCFHKYHKDCVAEWFKRQDFCPICRTKIQSQ